MRSSLFAETQRPIPAVTNVTILLRRRNIGGAIVTVRRKAIVQRSGMLQRPLSNRK
jgi:hypothetical protein